MHFLVSRLLPVALICILCAGLSSAEPPLKPQQHAFGTFDFPTCVRYALIHAEELLKARIDIQIRSADLKDAHSELLPTLSLYTRYYVSRAGQQNISNPVNVQILMENWNPYVALLKIKAQGSIVDIAKIAHIDKISSEVARLAKLFYGIHLLEKSIRANQQMLALYRNKISYGKSREEHGDAEPLELRSWECAYRSQTIRIKSLQKELEGYVSDLKLLIGFHPDYHLPLDTRDAANQVLGGFNGQLVTFTEIEASNLALKIAAKKEQVQSNKIMGAYVSLLPRPLIVFEDVQNQVDRTSGFNLAVGLDYTLWDGFRRVRDIKRQKMEFRKLNLDRHVQAQKLYAKFKDLRMEVGLSWEREVDAREKAKLTELREEMAFVEYSGGRISQDLYLDRRIDTIQAQVDAISACKNRVFALIELATIAGGLNKYNAAIRY
jgi:outer membrane protein TolC